ncbi:MAG: hypothetical protein HZC22_17045 [Rhodocyclales bacterium]|nr:hypothetical protein [Rhodocyclales bacterium]
MGIMNPGSQTGKSAVAPIDQHAFAAGYANFNSALSSARLGDGKARGLLSQLMSKGVMTAEQQSAARQAIGGLGL